ncbi:MAG: DUF488 family protein [candidate division KSB1 bacterium]|nr:DUF488 family protein [candidate division KSB1 bacterium]MDZ7365361.1 DUF488 family protein [candidate division KSB1 bacterium]MDZ7407388.1 DUF488 family protein [candidate division KSB1 bacterium]
MALKCKSIYTKPTPEDGVRVYVDRLWPEGISTRDAAVEWWAQDIAPSYELWRHGYALNKWPQYRESYLKELASRDKQATLDQLRQNAAVGNLTLLYGTDDPARNNAVVVREYLENGGSSNKKKK